MNDDEADKVRNENFPWIMFPFRSSISPFDCLYISLKLS